MTVAFTDPGTSAPSTLAGLHVLLVDDDPFMLELLAGMLRKMGVSRIASAEDGARALSALAAASFPPNVIICDLHMPNCDGFQLMESIAAQGFKGGVVLLSGMEERVLNSAALMGRFHHLNVLGVVQKPVSKAALGSLLAKAPQR